MNGPRRLAILCCLGVAASGVFAVRTGRAADLVSHPTIVRMQEENNRLRAMVGLPSQQLDESLCRAAQRHAQHMATSGHFSHVCCNGDPESRARRAGWRGGSCSENIANGQMGVAAAFSSWRRSSGHWANICSSSRKCGFGLAYRNGSPYWVAVYAS